MRVRVDGCERMDIDLSLIPIPIQPSSQIHGEDQKLAFHYSKKIKRVWAEGGYELRQSVGMVVHILTILVTHIHILTHPIVLHSKILLIWNFDFCLLIILYQ